MRLFYGFFHLFLRFALFCHSHLQNEIANIVAQNNWLVNTIAQKNLHKKREEIHKFLYVFPLFSSHFLYIRTLDTISIISANYVTKI